MLALKADGVSLGLIARCLADGIDPWSDAVTLPTLGRAEAGRPSAEAADTLAADTLAAAGSARPDPQALREALGALPRSVQRRLRRHGLVRGRGAGLDLAAALVTPVHQLSGLAVVPQLSLTVAAAVATAAERAVQQLDGALPPLSAQQVEVLARLVGAAAHASVAGIRAPRA